VAERLGLGRLAVFGGSLGLAVFVPAVFVVSVSEHHHSLEWGTTSSLTAGSAGRSESPQLAVL
jgi:hypothetical protein